MKKTLLAVTLAALTTGAATSALAADPKAPAPDFEISGNFAITSNYIFRGISQSNKKPALQGGVDFSHKSGFYAGNWNSSVSEWASPFSSGIESDLYAGYSSEFGGAGIDVGYITYIYPGARISTTDSRNAVDTQELYIGFSYGPASLKASRTMSDRYFGQGKDPGGVTLTSDAKGTMYYDLSVEHSLSDSVGLTVRAGMLDFANKTATTKTIYDYSVGVSYDLSGWGLGLTYSNTSGLSEAAKTAYSSTDGGVKKLFGSNIAVSLSKTF
jgi:uncharacterized protein (TIGR02001 family)